MRLSTSTWNQYCCGLSLLIVCGNIQIVVSEITFVHRFPRRDIFGYVSTNQCGSNAALNSGSVNSIECKCHNSYSTFLYSRKACVANSVTKDILFDNSDCSELLRLKDQHEEVSPYIVLDLQQGSQIKFYEHQVKGITGKNCRVDNTLYYIDDQTENQMSVNAGNVFFINTRKKTLKWKSLPTSILHGRVLRLVPTGCTISTLSTSSVNKPCIILKAKGIVTFSTSSVVSPTATLHPISSTQAVPVPSVVSPTATLHPSTIPSTQAVTSSSIPSILVTPSQSSPVPVKPTPVQSSNTPYHTQTVPGTSSMPSFTPTTRKSKDEQSFPVGAIVGSVMAVIAIVVIIVVIIIWRRRKLGRNTKALEELTNPNINELDNYAAVDEPGSQTSTGTGIYQTLAIDPNQESALDRHQDIPFDQSNPYNTVEHPVFQPPRKGPTHPLYNVLGRPNEDQLEPGTHDNPSGQSTGYENIQHPVFQPPRKGPTDPLYNVYVLGRPNEGQLQPGTHDNPTGQSTGYENVQHPVFQPPRKGPTDPLYNVLGRPNEGQLQPGTHDT